MRILLTPTGQHEAFAGRQFRVFDGRCDDPDVVLQMLGMFRVPDPAGFARLAAAMPPEAGPVVPALDALRLFTGVDERPTMANALRERLHAHIAGIRSQPARDNEAAAVQNAQIGALEFVLRTIEVLRGTTR